MRKCIDLTGQRFERLTVIKRADDYVSPKGAYFPQWLCKCDCGNKKIVAGSSLRSGATTSCGCYHKERLSETHRKHNTWELFMTTNIAVGTDCNGRKFTIDIEDWVKCKDICWWISNEGYVVTQSIKDKHIKLHRFLMNPPKDMFVDHINGDRANNCKSNLRIVTQQQNQMNHSIFKNNTSGHTGVCWDKGANKWEARIGNKGKTVNLGYFTNKEDAIKARQEAEIKYFGEYRRKD